jgi:hypothetical protein
VKDLWAAIRNWIVLIITLGWIHLSPRIIKEQKKIKLPTA